MFLARTDIPGEVIPLAAIGLGSVIVLVWVLCATVAEILKARGLERSRREIAAYIAEGTMTPEEGERILKAQPQNQA